MSAMTMNHPTPPLGLDAHLARLIDGHAAVYAAAVLVMAEAGPMPIALPGEVPSGSSTMAAGGDLEAVGDAGCGGRDIAARGHPGGSEADMGNPIARLSPPPPGTVLPADLSVADCLALIDTAGAADAVAAIYGHALRVAQLAGPMPLVGSEAWEEENGVYRARLGNLAPNHLSQLDGLETWALDQAGRCSGLPRARLARVGD